jgi:hypothetical protein
MPWNPRKPLCVKACEGIVGDHSGTMSKNAAGWQEDRQGKTWVKTSALLIWLVAAVVAFLPFAFDTSAWEAVTLHVPGNQGNWWHFLAGAPFFLAFPMVWLRLRSLFSTRPSTTFGQRLVWGFVGFSIAGTIAVEAPFLLHLAGTSEWQRFTVLSLGFGIVIASAAILFTRRSHISPTRACLAGLDAAYLANMALCLVVYAGAAGDIASRSGWFVSIVIVWPILLELAWLLGQTFRTGAS